MKILTFLTLVCLLSIGSTFASDTVEFKIRFGKDKELRTVVVALDSQSAALTVDNFRKLVRRGFYKGQVFHRAIPDYLVQIGDPSSKNPKAEDVGTSGPGYTLPAEINRPVKRGSLVMARLPDTINPSRASNGSQFFIALTDMPSLSGNHTVFGEVIEGIEVLDEISNQSTDTNDFPNQRISIRSARLQ